MNQNIFCSKCHRIPSQCCCSSAKELTDEEIESFEHLIAKAFDFSTQIKVVGLDRIIRAIIKKARE
jgi:hypothetical protein